MEVYLDNAATTKPCAEAVEAAVAAMTDNYGNPSSLHRVGLNAQLLMDSARKTIADSIGADSGCIYFTSGATESNNLALRGASAAYGRKRKKIVISAVEHASVDETAADLEKKGFEVVRVSPREDGRYYSADFLNACDDDTCLISMMYVNNETGYIMPVKETFTAVKRKYPDIITHTDCVQAYMKLPVKASTLCADLISLSGHKIHGAKGVGAIYIKKGVRVLPVVTGGKQEKGIRSGTESVPLIAAFGAAAKKLVPTIAERYEKVSGLKAYLLEKLGDIEGVAVNSPEDGSPYVVNISAGGKRSEIMLHYLESKEVYVSSGSACSKGQQSGVLGQFGIRDKRADSALRISMTAETTEAELDMFCEALREGMENVRG
ncbi:cysteine desulfurase family protein [Ruminococcus flavefaciens]|uniref:cysteine desulfurase family protein n=1 Tax=Ruminococcus flavefaciens TaxID=1265 RepID=UPI0026EA6765|nr:cysteine desulfurase family protein [Ruminococcus flavefaciens]MDD7517513.1 cysteine desulfurase family protein [Ruminococcus flavefaciens]MDY5691484.1 cysteine desulfurase family protein [Ruminococcus flavefaciens]